MSIPMKKIILNILDAMVAFAAVCATPFVPGWAVWLLCLPALYIAGLSLIHRNLPEVWQA